MSDVVTETEDGNLAPDEAEPVAPRLRREQPLVIRWAHWLNVPLLILMAASGLQIFYAYPSLGARGALYGWYPLQGASPPSWMRLGGWLAGARHWHFALAWFLVLNGAIYLAYFFASGEWRRRMFLPRRDATNALKMFAYYTRISRTPPPEDFYNGLQRLAYTSAILIGIVMVASGLAIYKPVQLHWLVAIFGGYDGARAVHFGGLCLLGAFVASHLVLVAAHPREIVKMINGGARAAIDKPS
ncbi:MAG TPA: cytochrome b/b6 domain-containing protein [Candidatus Binataceae bacterium]|nr:cytochrome b/b6 domain-containing protein [Candidatus Binataceae bacterium]